MVGIFGRNYIFFITFALSLDRSPFGVGSDKHIEKDVELTFYL